MPVLYDHTFKTKTKNKGTIIWGDAFEQVDLLKDESIDLVFTSPNPFLSITTRVMDGKPTDPRTLGMETEVDKYLNHLEIIFAKIKRKMKNTASLWVHMGDKGDYRTEMMQGIPERFFVDMITTWGWFAPEKPIWHRTEKSERKNNRHLKRNWEPVYHFVKDPDLYHFNEKTPYGNSSVFSEPFNYDKEWSKNVESGFPEEIVEAAINSCIFLNHGFETDEKIIILDPFAGTGTTGLVAKRMGMSFILMDIYERRCHAMAGRLQLLSPRSSSP